MVDYAGEMSLDIINEKSNGSFIIGIKVHLNEKEFVIVRQRYSYKGVPDLSVWENLPEETHMALEEKI